jgi:hypothetical protein
LKFPEHRVKAGSWKGKLCEDVNARGLRPSSWLRFTEEQIIAVLHEACAKTANLDRKHGKLSEVLLNRATSKQLQIVRKPEGIIQGFDRFGVSLCASP